MPTGRIEPGETPGTPPGTPVPSARSPPLPPPSRLTPPISPPGPEALEQHLWVPPVAEQSPPSGARRGLGPAGGGTQTPTCSGRMDPPLQDRYGPPPHTPQSIPVQAGLGGLWVPTSPPAPGSSLPWGGHTTPHPPTTPHSPQGTAPPGGTLLGAFFSPNRTKTSSKPGSRGGPAGGGDMPAVGGTAPAPPPPPRTPRWPCPGAAGPPP